MPGIPDESGRGTRSVIPARPESSCIKNRFPTSGNDKSKECPQIKITVVVPVLNEEKILRGSLSRLNLAKDEELVVVDGGSKDDSVSIAREFTESVFSSKNGKGRGSAMNVGAEKAGGEILLFLHADCELPDKAFNIIRKVLSDNSVSAGAFDIRIASPELRFRAIEAGANLRSRSTSIPYGDQGMFMRKNLFDSLGGFADLPIMEDIEISQRLKKTGRIVFVRSPVRTSARRWLKEGALYTTLRDWSIAFSYYFLRSAPEKLKAHYKDVR